MFGRQRDLVIKRLHSGGIITNYYCTSSCGHCLYYCSPRWEKEYIDRETLRLVLQKIKNLGCSSVHIGGGEPFLNLDGLAMVVEMARWISDFYLEIDGLDDSTTHGLAEYTDKYGDNYLARIPSRYWVHFGGRALKTFAKVYGTKDYRDIVAVNKGGCGELLDVSHFHIDLFGNYIPGLCSGLAISYEDLGEKVTQDKYPLLGTLYQGGIKGFLDLTTNEYGFEPSREYLSKCDLCFDIRHYLVMQVGITTHELQPRGYYEFS